MPEGSPVGLLRRKRRQRHADCAIHCGCTTGSLADGQPAQGMVLTRVVEVAEGASDDVTYRAVPPSDRASPERGRVLCSQETVFHLVKPVS